MSAQFGLWPPGAVPGNCRLIGRFVVGEDGSLIFSSLLPDGRPLVASTSRSADGTYAVTFTAPAELVAHQLQAQVLSGGDARYATVGQASILTYDDGGVLTDAITQVVVFDN